MEGETKTVIEMEIISVEGQCVDSNGENAADDAGPTDATSLQLPPKLMINSRAMDLCVVLYCAIFTNQKR